LIHLLVAAGGLWKEGWRQKMKNALLVGVSLAALGIGSASAADMAARAPAYTKAPVMPVAVYNWGGFYIGGNVGGASSHNCWDVNGLGVVGAGVVPVVPAVGEGCHSATGAVAGGQIGYRWQITNWVFGLEAQGDWANLKGSNLSSSAAFGTIVTNQTKINSLGLFTGQVGYAWNNVLGYLKGGAAVTDDKYNGIVTPVGVAFDQASETRWGGAIGAGLEFGFAPGWSVGVEYDHLFMGNQTRTFTALTGPVGAITRTDNIKQDIDMGTVRFNYTFGGPVVAQY
jgi:outer membrane immunogenic protein